MTPLQAILAQSSFHHLNHPLRQTISLWMISRSGAVIHQALVTQVLKFTTKLSTLVGQHLGWSSKMAKHSIQECIGNAFARLVRQRHKLDPLGEMLHHNQHVPIVT
jgi:hypothetical protein